MIRNLFSIRLLGLIQESGKMQKDICADLHISKQKITRWKNGYNEPCLDEILMLAEYFKVSTDYLLGYVDEFGTKMK